MQDTLSAITEDTSSKKRGRKTVNVNYFDTREENAVKEFLIAKTYEEKSPGQGGAGVQFPLPHVRIQAGGKGEGAGAGDGDATARG